MRHRFDVAKLFAGKLSSLPFLKNVRENGSFSAEITQPARAFAEYFRSGTVRAL
jgi:hypothetical protein